MSGQEWETRHGLLSVPTSGVAVEKSGAFLLLAPLGPAASLRALKSLPVATFYDGVPLRGFLEHL